MTLVPTLIFIASPLTISLLFPSVITALTTSLLTPKSRMSPNISKLFVVLVPAVIWHDVPEGTAVKTDAVLVTDAACAGTAYAPAKAKGRIVDERSEILKLRMIGPF